MKNIISKIVNITDTFILTRNLLIVWFEILLLCKVHQT